MGVLRLIQTFFFFLDENICCDPSLEPSLMVGHNICFKRVWKIIPKLSLLPLLICSTVTKLISLFYFELYQGNKLEGDVGDIVSLQAKTSPYFQLSEKFKCIEHIDKSKTQLKTSP